MTIILFLTIAFMLTGCTAMTQLPPYVVINDSDCTNKEVLRTLAQPVSFPLSEEDKYIIKTLEAKYDQEVNCAGLAAPQIGFNKRIIVFAVHDDPELRKWRPDLIDTMPKTIWLNPSYEPLGLDQHEDYEGCFSVKDLAGPVKRFKTIRYTAYKTDGSFVDGTAQGFLARLIQHEVDHLNGRLFIDLVPQDKLLSAEEYRAMRIQAIQQGHRD